MMIHPLELSGDWSTSSWMAESSGNISSFHHWTWHGIIDFDIGILKKNCFQVLMMLINLADDPKSWYKCKL